MEAFGLILIFVVIGFLVKAVIHFLPYFAAGLLIWGIVVLAMKCYYKGRVVKAEIISEEPIVKNEAVNTGYTKTWGGGLRFHEHYEYQDVIKGYEVRFWVTYRNGDHRVVLCEEGDAVYKTLIKKCKREKHP